MIFEVWRKGVCQKPFSITWMVAPKEKQPLARTAVRSKRSPSDRARPLPFPHCHVSHWEIDSGYRGAGLAGGVELSYPERDHVGGPRQSFFFSHTRCIR